MPSTRGRAVVGSHQASFPFLCSCYLGNSRFCVVSSIGRSSPPPPCPQSFTAWVETQPEPHFHYINKITILLRDIFESTTVSFFHALSLVVPLLEFFSPFRLFTPFSWSFRKQLEMLLKYAVPISWGKVDQNSQGYLHIKQFLCPQFWHSL